MKTIFVALFLVCFGRASAHGFNANYVYLARLPNGAWRVTIKYTHVELGEYREANIDFTNYEDANKAFVDLKNGADFFLGDTKKSIHFHKPPQRNKPY